MALITSQYIDIEASPDSVWRIVSDIENADKVITGIKNIEIVKPADGPDLVGLTWRETREFMGKDADETMWVTDANPPEFYATRAENHGSVYQSKIELEPITTGTRLTMDFHCHPQTWGAKILWLLTGWMAKKSLCNVIQQDLDDIKLAAEDIPLP